MIPDVCNVDGADGRVNSMRGKTPGVRVQFLARVPHDRARVGTHFVSLYDSFHARIAR
jgi:hypothetical protein